MKEKNEIREFNSPYKFFIYSCNFLGGGIIVYLILFVLTFNTSLIPHNMRWTSDEELIKSPNLGDAFLIFILAFESFIFLSLLYISNIFILRKLSLSNDNKRLARKATLMAAVLPLGFILLCIYFVFTIEYYKL